MCDGMFTMLAQDDFLFVDFYTHNRLMFGIEHVIRIARLVVHLNLKELARSPTV